MPANKLTENCAYRDGAPRNARQEKKYETDRSKNRIEKYQALYLIKHHQCFNTFHINVTGM